MEGSKPISEMPPSPASASDLPVMKPSFTSRDHNLLRASRVHVVLGGMGALFRSSAGSAETYALSEPVSQIDTFLSHNWSTPRLEKFAVLALHYNFVPAAALTALAMAGIFTLTAIGVLPLVDFMASPSIVNPALKSGYCATLLGPWIFLLFLFTWHELAGRLGLMRARIFLDKTCIDQVDAQRKQKGILSLAAFLERTDSMLALYSPVYLRRLWTAFELASLLILYPEKELVVIPTYFPRPIVIGMLIIHLGTVFFFLGRAGAFGADSGPLAQHFDSFAPLCMGVFISLSSYRHVLSKRSFWSEAESFSLANAACEVESDRELVSRSVQDFLKERQLVPQDASREQALEAFDRMVRRDVPRKLLALHGALGYPYKYLAMVFAPRWFVSVDATGAFVHQGAGIWQALFAASVQLNMALVVLPLTAALSLLALERILLLRRPWQAAAAGACVVAAAGAFDVVCQSVTLLVMGLFMRGWRGIATAGLLLYIIVAGVLMWCLTHGLARARIQDSRAGEDGWPGPGPGLANDIDGGDRERASLIPEAS